MKLLKLFMCALLSLVVISCGGGGNSGTNNTSLNTVPIPSKSKSNSNTANLVASVINPVINPANGSAPQTIRVVNNGAGTATNIRVSSNAPVTTSNNDCSSLAPSASCTFNINANSNISGQSPVFVSYGNASSWNSEGNLVLNVFYISPTPGPRLNVVSIQEGLNNVQINTTGHYSVIIKNMGNMTFNNIIWDGLSAPFSFDPSSSCTTGQQLNPGEFCTLVIDYSPTVIGSGITNIEVYGFNSGNQVISTASNWFTYSSTIGYYAAHLITSAVNPVINPANGSAPQTIRLVNNGVVNATNIEVIGNTPVTVSNNDCSSLEPLASCTFNINANSNISGYSSVLVLYNNNASSGNTEGELPFNVIYIAEPSPGLTLTSSEDGLNNVPVGTTEYYNIVVKNIGNVAFNDFGFTTLTAPFSWGPDGTCNMSGSQVLNPGQSCTLSVKYSPTEVGSGIQNVIAIANYVDQGGYPLTYTGMTSFHYNSVASGK